MTDVEALHTKYLDGLIKRFHAAAKKERIPKKLAALRRLLRWFQFMRSLDGTVLRLTVSKYHPVRDEESLPSDREPPVSLKYKPTDAHRRAVARAFLELIPKEE